jgi:hypothetical protein
VDELLNQFWQAHRTHGPPGLTDVSAAPDSPLQGSHHPEDAPHQMAWPLVASNPAAVMTANVRALHREAQRPMNSEPFIANDAHQPEVDISIPHLIHGRTASWQTVWSPTTSLCTHFGGVGATGDGKSTIAQPIAVQAVGQGAICVVLDGKKTWHRLLALPELANRAYVLNAKQMAISISQPPPGSPAEDWWPVVVDIFGTAFGRYRAHHLLFDLFKASAQGLPPGRFAALSHLIRHARELAHAGRNRQTDLAMGLHESLLQMAREMGDVYDTHFSTMPEQLFKTPGRLYIIQPQGESLEQQQFYMTYLLKWVYTARKEDTSGVGSFPPVVFFFEDGSNLLDSRMDQNSLSGTSPIASTTDVSREFGIGIFVVGHSLTSLSKKIIRNIKSWIVVGLQGEDLALAKNLLGLTEAQSRGLLRLGKGEAVGLFPEVNRHAVFFTYPKLEVPQ